MAKMKDTELSSIVDSLIQDSVSYNSEFMKANEEYLRRYNQECYGDEESGYSQVISSDVRDTVDSDMTSMVRVFLGSGDVLVFESVTDDPDELKEAEEKTKLINYLALRRPGAYQTIHGFLKDAEIQKAAIVHYYVDDEIRKTKEEVRKDLTVEQITLLIEELKKADDTIEDIEIVEKESLDEEGKFNFRIRATHTDKDLIIKNIPTEQFLLSRNSSSIDEAQMVGHESYPYRSELVASGMSEEEVAKFPTSDGSQSVTQGDQNNTGNGQAENMRAIRWRDEGGDITDRESFVTWSNEKVKQVLMFAYIDCDGDGIAERRRIVKIGDQITENEPYDHAPYAITSCIIEPHKAIGDSRASLVVQDQSVNTELERAMLDNIYDVGNPRTLLGNGVNADDFFDDKRSGVVRMKSSSTESAMQSIVPLTVPYVGGEIMQIKQSRDQSKAARTGTMLDSQGLEADNLHQETATRFSGIEKANEAKIELVARNHAETGFRKLYDGIAWTLQRFMDKEIRVRIDGKAIAVNPSEWKYDAVSVSRVGLGAGAGDKAVQQLTGVLSIQQQMQATGSLLVDDQKIYNTLDQMAQALGFASVSEFFNNPDAPPEMIFAQYQQLVKAMEQSQAQIEELSQKNPLAEAEMIRAQASLETARN
ncbi:MAG: portal protein, partial [Candidatus Nezhaarchaeales archaeon]